MLKGKGMKSCGDEWIYNPSKNRRSISFEKEFCIKGYLLYSIIKGLLKRLLLENGWLIGETKENNFKEFW